MFRPASAWRGVRWGYTLERHGRVHETPQPVVRREPETDGGLERQRVLRRQVRGQEPPGYRAREEGRGVHGVHGHLPPPPPGDRHQAHGALRGYAGQDISRPHRPPRSDSLRTSSTTSSGSCATTTRRWSGPSSRAGRRNPASTGAGTTEAVSMDPGDAATEIVSAAASRLCLDMRFLSRAVLSLRTAVEPGEGRPFATAGRSRSAATR